ncbi:MAG: NADPH-dependent F420 reductase [Candidatus Binatia bacterium]|nr:NADPH-dependent F420 reductase [Candidatus Binatia bacterium]
MARIGLLGGTGPEGKGLALRFAAIGEEVRVGSRQKERAQEVAAKLQEKLRSHQLDGTITGGENGEVADWCEAAVLTFPYEGVETLLPPLQPALAGKIVMDTINPMELRDGVFHLMRVPAGSAGERIQELLPASRVVACFKNSSAKELMDLNEVLHGDILLCGNVPEANAWVAQLVRRIPELRAVDAGMLANAHHLESITTLLMNLNRRYKALTSIQILGLPKTV